MSQRPPEDAPGTRAHTHEVFTQRFDDLAAIAYRVAFRILGDRHQAEELAQEALARAYSRWRKVSAYAEPWVARVAGNLAIDVVRRKPLPDIADGVPAEHDSVVVLRMELQQALRALPTRQR